MTDKKVVTYVFVSKIYGAQQYVSINEEAGAYMLGNIQATGFNTENRVSIKLRELKRLIRYYENRGFTKYDDEATEETRAIFQY